MHTRAISLSSLLLSALLCVAQSASPSSMQTVTASIEDTGSGQPLPSIRVQVQLFPPEHGARKLLSLLCVPSDDAQPLFSFDVTTDPNGGFSLTAAGGDYLAKITIPQRQPIFGCIFVDTEASVRRCTADPSPLRIHQHLFVRTARSIPGFSGDILINSACAPYQPSPCDSLRVPNLIMTKKVMLVDPEGNPIHDARLEFHEYTKEKGKFIANVMTDASGVADVSSLGGLLRMSITSERASGEFLIDFTKDAKPGQQTIKMFHWRCRGNLMKGAMVQP